MGTGSRPVPRWCIPAGVAHSRELKFSTGGLRATSEFACKVRSARGDDRLGRHGTHFERIRQYEEPLTSVLLSGVESYDISLEEKKVVVKGNVDPETVKTKIAKCGKATEFWS